MAADDKGHQIDEPGWKGGKNGKLWHIQQLAVELGNVLGNSVGG